MGNPAANPMGVEWFGLVMGLGFVLSFGYWCTDFLVVQRAMAADSMNSARRTPLIAALPKMVFPFLVILPGMIAISVAAPSDTALARSTPARLSARGDGAGRRAHDAAGDAAQPHPAEAGRQGQPDRRHRRPRRARLRPRDPADADAATSRPGMLGLGLCALMASFMSGMAGNTTAFNTVWTYDIYQSYIKPGATDAHYLRWGRAATVFGILISVGAAFVARQFNNIMDLLQLVFAFVNAPLFATFMLGMFWKRTTGHGAFTGLLAGTLAAALHHGLTLPVGAVVGFKGGFLGQVRAHVSERDGAELLDGHLRLDDVLRRDGAGVAVHRAEAGRGAEGPRLRADADSARRNLPWHKRPGMLADDRAGVDAVAECDLLVAGSRAGLQPVAGVPYGHSLPTGIDVRDRGRAAAGLRRDDGVEPDVPKHSLGVNVNLWSGLGMLAFGLTMLWLARRAATKTPPRH